jgi:hypothetical protein
LSGFVSFAARWDRVSTATDTLVLASSAECQVSRLVNVEPAAIYVSAFKLDLTEGPAEPRPIVVLHLLL